MLVTNSVEDMQDVDYILTVSGLMNGMEKRTFNMSLAKWKTGETNVMLHSNRIQRFDLRGSLSEL